MRDPFRIDYYCNILAEIWHQLPDWRLSQLLCNVINRYRDEHNGQDPFYLEEDEFFRYMDKALHAIVILQKDNNEST
jgi:hypothetical protein